ncbi:MAG TPA: hypothetical protein VKS21_11385 [Spirochaetota bacterium]|nr:hypothetical protein [Spirochaetota bacterium]
MKIAVTVLLTVVFSWSSQYYHFSSNNITVHFRRGYTNTAVKTLACAQDILPQITNFLNVSYNNKLDIVLNPDYFSANGYSTGIPQNMIVIFTTPAHQAFSLRQAGRDWLYEIVLHELVHEVHLNRKTGMIGFFSHIFGNSFHSFWKNPDSWNKEGLAVYLESKFSPGGKLGRLNYNLFKTIALTAAAHGTFPGIREVNNEPGLWSMDHTYYIYGSLFTRYLAQKYGEKKLARYFVKSTSIFPLFKDIPFKKIYGCWPPEIWNDFQKHYRKLARQSTAINREKEACIEHRTSFPAPVTYVSNKIHYVTGTAAKPVAIKTAYSAGRTIAMPPQLSHPVLIKGNNKNIFLLANHKLGTRFMKRDIYLYTNCKFQRLTGSGNIMKAVYIKKIKCFLAMAREKEKTVFYLIGPNGYIHNTRVVPLDAKMAVLDFAVSPDGHINAFELENRQGEKNIFISYYNYANSISNTNAANRRKYVNFAKVIKITSNNNYKADLFFSENNNLYFTTISRDQWRLHQYNGNRIKQIHTAATGIFYPCIKNNTLYYFTLNRRGYYLQKKPIDDRRYDFPVKIKKIRSLELTTNSIPALTPQSSSFFKGCRPYHRMPYFNFSFTRKKIITAGLLLRGANIFNDFSYILDMNYATVTKAFTYFFSISKRFPKLFTRLSFTHSFNAHKPFLKKNFTAGINFPYHKPVGNGLWRLTYRYTDPRNIIYKQNLSGKPFTNLYTNKSRSSGLVAGLVNNNTKQVRRSTFPVAGSVFLFNTGFYSPYLGSQLEQIFIQADLHFFQRLLPRLTIHHRYAAATAFGKDKGLCFSYAPVNNLLNYQHNDILLGIRNGIDLVTYFNGRAFPGRLFGNETRGNRFSSIAAASLDIFINLADYYKVVRFFPWFLFQNLTLALYYDFNFFHHRHYQIIKTGPGLALDLRFSSFFKINIGTSWAVDNNHFYHFLNIVADF